MKYKNITNKKKQFNQSILVLLVVTMLALFGACHKGWWFEDHIEGSGNVISEERNTGYFNTIKLYGSGRVYVTQGPELQVEIQAEDNIMRIIRTQVEGDTLVVDTDHSYSSSFGIKIYVTMPDIRGFELYGAWKLYGQNVISAANLDLGIYGAGLIDMNLNVDHMFTDISGAGSIHLSGSANSHSLIISGAGELNAEDLEVKIYDIVVSGSGNCRVNVLQSMTVTISGSGNVYYRGNPSSVNSSISGTGKVVRL